MNNEKIARHAETLAEIEHKFINVFESLCALCNDISVDNGFWASKTNFGEKIALMHSELSEALEADRTRALSDKLPGYRGAEEELADCIIRICDAAGGYDFSLASAIIEKIRYNLTRPYKHGKAY